MPFLTKKVKSTSENPTTTQSPWPKNKRPLVNSPSTKPSRSSVNICLFFPVRMSYCRCFMTIEW